MTQFQQHRTITRKTAIALMVLVVATCALAVWFGLVWVELYADQMSRLVDSDPEQARARMLRDAKLIAVVTGVSISALALFLFSYGLRSLRAQSMPPGRSWVVEGQRTWTGPAAVFRAKLLLIASAVICLLGIAAGAMLWHLPGALSADRPPLTAPVCAGCSSKPLFLLDSASREGR